MKKSSLLLLLWLVGVIALCNNVIASAARPIAPQATNKNAGTGASQALDDSTFESFLASAKAEDETVMVMMYAPWCGHCKRLKPVWEEASLHFQRTKPDVLFATVDCTKAKFSCQRMSVRRYPTLFAVTPDGLMHSMMVSGKRDVRGVVAFASDPHNLGESGQFPGPLNVFMTFALCCVQAIEGIQELFATSGQRVVGFTLIGLGVCVGVTLSFVMFAFMPQETRLVKPGHPDYPAQQEQLIREMEGYLARKEVAAEQKKKETETKKDR